MEGEYPRFKSSYFQEELVEGFHLGPDEFDFIFKPSRRCQSPRDRHPFEIIAASELFPRRIFFMDSSNSGWHAATCGGWPSSRPPLWPAPSRWRAAASRGFALAAIG